MTFSLSSRNLAALICCAAVLGLASSARAQQNSLFGGAGPGSGTSGFGTSTTGASFGVGTGTGMSSGFGSSGGMGMGTGMGMGMGAGQTGMGMAGTGMTGSMGGMQGMGQQQRTGLVGQSNQRFVGNAQAGQQTMNQNRQGQNRGTGNRRTTGQNPNQANQGTQGNPAQGRTIRPQLMVAFNATRPTIQKSAGNLSARFEKLSSRAGFEGITVQTEGNNVILRGQVDSAETSRVAAALARMEPGVRSVKNELKVKSAPAN